MAVVLALLSTGFRSAAPAAEDRSSASFSGSHWVVSWMAPAQSSSLDRPIQADPAPRTFRDRRLRIRVTPHHDGAALRLHIGNRYGTGPLTVDDVGIARHPGRVSVVDELTLAVTFGGKSAAVIPPGAEAVSDAVIADVVAFEDLAVTFHVVGAAPLDYHLWSGTTNYVTAPGRRFDDAQEGAPAAITGTFGIASVDVLTSRSTGVVAALGDSITDGLGSSRGTNQRWPDALARRLASAGVDLSVVNAGIAGNTVVAPTSVGPTAVRRVARDALAQPGVTDLIVFEGINDIFGSPDEGIGMRVAAGYLSIIGAAHRSGVRVMGATITPARLVGSKEATRQAVNTWIRTSGAFDSVVDFDAVVRDPTDPTRVRPEYDAGFAHLLDGGYRALAASIELCAFEGAGRACPPPTSRKLGVNVAGRPGVDRP